MAGIIGNSLTVQTKAGKLLGTLEDDLAVFRGIQYAAPPTGALRWMPPQPVTPWPRMRAADRFRAICPQDVGPSAIPGRKPSVEPQNEDCLHLNVWTPAADNLKRPVMIWIHGGAFLHGSGSSPNTTAANLAKRGSIVVVTINYRLGCLGFMNLDHLTGGKIPSTGNEGLLDQLAALRWVKDNIGAFGGDPDNVTVFGESAGAESIGGLLALAESKGLFQKAILESGASKAQSLERADKAAENFVGRLGLTGKDADKLRELPVEALIKVQAELALGAGSGVSGAGVSLGPVQDGKYLKGVPIDAVEKGSAKDVTVLAGSNLEEGKLFASMGPNIKNMDEAGLAQRAARLVTEKNSGEMIEKYRKALAKRDLPVTPYEIYVAIMGDQHFRMPNIRLCEYQEKLGKAAYGYVFTWKSVVPDLGACHALDVGFVFGNLTREFEGDNPAARKLSGQMQDAWIAFARKGHPSTPELPWPRYGKDRGMMVLSENSHAERAPYEAERAAWDGMPNTMLG
jgi:para-nitrobenzyl esterase